ncbi:unnamed protein product [Arabis nemorensis]|uniref:Reverse transcriptase zinc-binding domain-containing protein n=1 Tax=Arabis nemorensis TaxID=586526 RepID=A0A565BH37_9BRAS|nr:unnamed protein product [Arabis nemorensis]
MHLHSKTSTFEFDKSCRHRVQTPPTLLCSAEDSLTGILLILEDFKKVSGLGINKEKTFLFLDGGNLIDSQQLCDDHGISQGSFPMKYLGELRLLGIRFVLQRSLEWVSWVRLNLIEAGKFWDSNITSGSWVWKQLCKLRHLARSFIFCEIGSGITASFWHDNWTSLGPLIDITETTGPSRSGLPIDVVVSDAIINARWWIDGTRSRNPIISLLRQCLPSPILLLIRNQMIVINGKIGYGGIPKDFSASETWRAIHPPGQRVGWFKAVWFKGRIPKHSFICWVTARNRMHTRDRLRSWGLQVSPRCLLCDVEDETRQHLFFNCPYSHEIWYAFYSVMNLTPPTDFEQCLLWLLSPSAECQHCIDPETSVSSLLIRDMEGTKC